MEDLWVNRKTEKERDRVYVLNKGLFVLLLLTIKKTVWNNLSVYLN